MEEQPTQSNRSFINEIVLELPTIATIQTYHWKQGGSIVTERSIGAKQDSRGDAFTADSNIKEELNKFKGSFLEEFNELKTAFLTKINCFKRQLLRAHETSQGTSQSSEVIRLTLS